MEDLYKILKVEKTASQEEIRESYLFLVKAYHPDRYQESKDKSRAGEELKKINYAYSILGDELKRKEYDYRSPSSPNANKESRTPDKPDTEDESVKILEYYEKLISKWDSILKCKNFSSINLRKIDRLQYLLSSILEKAMSVPDPLIKETKSAFNQQVAQMAKVSYALGLEYASNNDKLQFDKSKLIQNSTVYPIVIIYEFISVLPAYEQFNQTVIDSMSEIPVCCNEIAEIIFSYGYKKYKKTSHETETNKSSEDNNNVHNYEKSFCLNCHNYSITTKTTYRKNIGMIFRRKYSKISGEFCADCQEKLFWDALKINIFLGWWGTISFIINPFLILMNIGNYIGSWKIRREDSESSKSAVDWKLVLPVITIIAIGLISKVNSNGLIKLPNSTGQVHPTVTKAALTSTTFPSILYSDDFSKTNTGWALTDSQNGKSEYGFGKLLISNPVKNMMMWRLAGLSTYTDGILKVDLINESYESAYDSGHIIIWRYKDEDNFYFMEISDNGEVYIEKYENDTVTILFSSDGIVSGTNQGVVPIMISYVGNKFDFYVANYYLTSIYDSSYSTGYIGLGVTTGNNGDGKAVFDNLKIYSSSEISKLTENIIRINPSSVKITQNAQATSQADSNEKVYVTVINKAPLPQTIYCAGIFIWEIQAGETKTFRFQRGTWRLENCYPGGEYPCDNYYYADLNGPTYSFTIQ